ncbi:MAG: DUF1684 domain-containing protein [Saprospiraceae bacterium]
MSRTFITLFLLTGWSLILPAQTPEAIFSAQIAQHRAEYKADFLVEARSPLTASDTAFLDFFAPNPMFQFPANFIRTPEAVPFELPTYSGQKRDYVQFGVLTFEFAGTLQTMNIYQNLRLVKDSTYRDHLFLPFKDLTSGGATYGGGRYLDFKQGDIRNGILILDFNKAYNPWCAFSDGFNCPIPPAPNHLKIAIEAGERNFKGEKKH